MAGAGGQDIVDLWLRVNSISGDLTALTKHGNAMRSLESATTSYDKKIDVLKPKILAAHAEMGKLNAALAIQKALFSQGGISIQNLMGTQEKLIQSTKRYIQLMNEARTARLNLMSAEVRANQSLAGGGAMTGAHTSALIDRKSTRLNSSH